MRYFIIEPKRSFIDLYVPDLIDHLQSMSAKKNYFELIEIPRIDYDELINARTSCLLAWDKVNLPTNKQITDHYCRYLYTIEPMIFTNIDLAK